MPCLMQKKGSGLNRKPETNLNKTNYNTKYNPDEDISEPDPGEHPEDLSRRKTPCEELDFPKIRTSLYNQIYFYINQEEMEAA